VNKHLFAACGLVVTLMVAAPALGQAYIGGGPTPGGVDVAPVGPGYYRSGEYWRGDQADLGECRVFRERIVTPSGRVVFRTRRDCY
jgi:hypothetical protein